MVQQIDHLFFLEKHIFIKKGISNSCLISLLDSLNPFQKFAKLINFPITNYTIFLKKNIFKFAIFAWLNKSNFNLLLDVSILITLIEINLLSEIFKYITLLIRFFSKYNISILDCFNFYNFFHIYLKV